MLFTFSTWRRIGLCSLVFAALPFGLSGQTVKLKNAQTWSLSGKIQVQHLYNSSIESNADKTNNGFRIRRGRFQIKTHLNDFISTKFQIEVRDNNPTLKDAEGKIALANNLFLRFGQFKVPVWREELRSSSKLFLVERSLAAEFLAKSRLSARHIGVELGFKTSSGVHFAAHYSNGAGEGIREDAGRGKGNFVNNGKMVVARIDAPLGKKARVGISAVRNSVGSLSGSADNRGTATLLAPDFNIKFAAGNNASLEIEAGIATGSISKAFTEEADDTRFTLIDISGEWKKKLAHAHEALGGLDGIGFAAGYSSVDDGAKVSSLRFGPNLTFGKKTRLQLNAELESPEGGDRIVKFRSMVTFNY